MEGTSKGHLVLPLCSNKDRQSWFLKMMSTWLLNVPKDGDSTGSLENLFGAWVPSKYVAPIGSIFSGLVFISCIYYFNKLL